MLNCEEMKKMQWFFFFLNEKILNIFSLLWRPIKMYSKFLAVPGFYDDPN